MLSEPFVKKPLFLIILLGSIATAVAIIVVIIYINNLPTGSGSPFGIIL